LVKDSALYLIEMIIKLVKQCKYKHTQNIASRRKIITRDTEHLRQAAYSRDGRGLRDIYPVYCPATRVLSRALILDLW